MAKILYSLPEARNSRRDDGRWTSLPAGPIGRQCRPECHYDVWNDPFRLFEMFVAESKFLGDNSVKSLREKLQLEEIEKLEKRSI